jgi:nicotinamide mononucleotide transporter
MHILDWISKNYLEIFGAVTGILYVFLEIRQNMWLWPVGIVTSAVYIWVFFHGKLYADMSLQIYYLAVSALGWYWWLRAGGVPDRMAPSTDKHPLKGAGGVSLQSNEQIDPVSSGLVVHRLNMTSGILLSVVFIVLYFSIWYVLQRFTDSPVPAFDSFITSLSIVATWMLARKIFEHWYLWIIVNSSAAILFFTRGLYPTVILYIVYCIMSFAGLYEWRKSLLKSEK